MSIEKNLERIADSLEAIAAAYANVTNVKMAVVEKLKEESAKPKAGSSTTKPSTSKKGSSKKSSKASSKKSSGPSIDDARAALKDLGKAKSSSVSRELLTSFGAGTLSALDEDKYQELIDAAKAMCDE